MGRTWGAQAAGLVPPCSVRLRTRGQELPVAVDVRPAKRADSERIEMFIAGLTEQDLFSLNGGAHSTRLPTQLKWVDEGAGCSRVLVAESRGSSPGPIVGIAWVVPNRDVASGGPRRVDFSVAVAAGTRGRGLAAALTGMGMNVAQVDHGPLHFVLNTTASNHAMRHVAESLFLADDSLDPFATDRGSRPMVGAGELRYSAVLDRPLSPAVLARLGVVLPSKNNRATPRAGSGEVPDAVAGRFATAD